MAAAAILDFRNSQILLAEGAWSAEKHHHAKFNESIMDLLQYFYFFKMATATILHGHNPVPSVAE